MHHAGEIGIEGHAYAQSVDVAEVFGGGIPGHYLYTLQSMVSYYGLHYHAFVKDAHSGIWRMFDDANASEVGRHIPIIWINIGIEYC